MTGIWAWPAVRLRAALGARELSAREVVQAHLDRIEQVNPDVNAVVTLAAERALAEAHAADELAASGAELPPLHGLPVLHKDTHETAGIRTTYGSPLRADYVPERDELVVERMRAAGGISLGKTNTPEFAAGSHTFNTVFGTTRNPYDTGKSAGGSSGGAAVALACGMAPLAEGSDMGGSLRNPASFNGVVGLRPTPGRVPQVPAQLGWSTMSVQGPMARTVDDAALLLSVLAGPDPRCPISLAEPGATFAAPLERDLTGLRVAWSPNLGGAVPVDREVAAVVEASARVFAGLGCEVERDCPDFAGADEVFRTLRAWQFEVAYGPLLETGRLKESIRWNVEEGRRLTGSELGRAEVLHTELHRRMVAFFRRFDVLLLPVSQVPPFDAGLEYPTEIAGVAMESYLDWMRSAYLVSATGCPAISVPAGHTAAGLPVGLQIVAAPRAEFALLQAARGFEDAVTLPAPAPLD
ncbi:amidase [Amycolatopsis acidicola]|uniref:Amidase n=1 Tax=Amycolatopsis acidicola TaxID=2596893 RepID=A0A5N0URL7_9PSEU|nr:amidase [Amycolatopsis acidicola]KAA9151215.1 amidase [Amycolatopsis acidicola]